jgi:hypothetical protein
MCARLQLPHRSRIPKPDLSKIRFRPRPVSLTGDALRTALQATLNAQISEYDDVRLLDMKSLPLLHTLGTLPLRAQPSLGLIVAA